MIKPILQNLTLILTGKRPVIDAWHYLVGHYRYKLYYKGKPNKHRLMRSHIYEQINWRIAVMDRECYNNGSCKVCGCTTTELQMSDKSCDKPCYPPMMNETMWDFFLQGNRYYPDSKEETMWLYGNGEPLYFKQDQNTKEYVQINIS